MARGGHRLSHDLRVEVASLYAAGRTTTQLAKECGVAKSTIIGILCERNVVARRQPVTAEQVGKAEHVCSSGLSLSQVTKRLEVNQETMRVAIIAAGVTLRPPTQAKQS